MENCGFVVQMRQNARRIYSNIHQKHTRKDFGNVKSVLSIDFRQAARYNASANERWEDLGWYQPVTQILFSSRAGVSRRSFPDDF
ncbi:MAG: hypothetical protein ACLRXG_01055 [Oscillospiraceae bacterium]